MLKVIGYTSQDEAKVVEFIRKVQASADPDPAILSCSVLIKDDNQIVGMVSYEPHGSMGIIRYFLYDARIAGTDLMVGMFFELYKKARNKGIKKLLAQIPTPAVGKLFEMLGFADAIGDAEVISKITKQNVSLMSINLDTSYN